MMLYIVFEGVGNRHCSVVVNHAASVVLAVIVSVTVTGTAGGTTTGCVTLTTSWGRPM
jgi:hypothetical protein